MQVVDKPELLDLMLQDLRRAPEEYRPTNFWEVHARNFLPELTRLGLRDFRRRKNSVLGSFGATDPEPLQIDFRHSVAVSNRLTRQLPFHDRMLRALNSLAHRRPVSDAGLKRLQRVLPVRTSVYYEITPDDLRQMAYDYVRARAEKAGARPIHELEVSLAGNPEDVFEIEGRTYTMATFFYYLHYVYARQFIDFDGVKVFVELGSGMGKQVEVIRKLHPNVCFLLFDIPPQLYVGERYLDTVFPGDVVSYATTRDLSVPPAIEPGKIFMFGAWQFPLLERQRIDLFWNAASFQEMEPNVVANYLRTVNGQADAVFLHEIMHGQELATRKGAGGVLQQTTLEHYRRGLPDFDLVDVSPSRQPAGHLLPHHSDSFWRRKAGARAAGPA
jgi:putative sugar O-methyltransferase